MMQSYGNYSWWGPAPLIGLGFLGVLGMVIGAAVLIAVIILKGYALWNAAKRDDKWWFVIMLVVNTLGILELCYLIFVVKKWHKGVASNPASGAPSSSAGA